ncbi:MAG: EF-hand domain-containing protein [Chloroflexota bacterium]
MPPHSLSALRQQKLRYLFRILDVNNSGRIDADDIQLFVAALAAGRNYPQDSLAFAALKRAYMYIWERLSKQIDLNKDRKVTADEWLAFFDAVVDDENFYRYFIRPIERTMVSLLDVDGDNKIRLVDYRMLARALKLSPDEVEQVFDVMDVNRNGILAEEEAAAAIQQFFLSDDVDATGNWFFGDYRK